MHNLTALFSSQLSGSEPATPNQGTAPSTPERSGPSVRTVPNTPITESLECLDFHGRLECGRDTPDRDLRSYFGGRVRMQKVLRTVDGALGNLCRCSVDRELIRSASLTSGLTGTKPPLFPGGGEEQLKQLDEQGGLIARDLGGGENKLRRGVLVLFWRCLKGILEKETTRLGSCKHDGLLGNEIFVQCLVVVCAEVVGYCEGKAEYKWPYFQRSVGVDPFEVCKVIETFVRVGNFPRGVKRHLNEVEEMILERDIWDSTGCFSSLMAAQRELKCWPPKVLGLEDGVSRGGEGEGKIDSGVGLMIRKLLKLAARR